MTTPSFCFGTWPINNVLYVLPTSYFNIIHRFVHHEQHEKAISVYYVHFNDRDATFEACFVQTLKPQSEQESLKAGRKT